MGKLIKLDALCADIWMKEVEERELRTKKEKLLSRYRRNRMEVLRKERGVE